MCDTVWRVTGRVTHGRVTSLTGCQGEYLVLTWNIFISKTRHFEPKIDDNINTQFKFRVKLRFRNYSFLQNIDPWSCHDGPGKGQPMAPGVKSNICSDDGSPSGVTTPDICKYEGDKKPGGGYLWPNILSIIRYFLFGEILSKLYHVSWYWPS